MLTALVIPDVKDDGDTDLGRHFDQHRAVFFGLIIAMLAASIAKEAVLTHKLSSPLNLAFHLMFMALAVIGILMRAYRAQLLLSIAAVIGFLAYVALLFARL
jgi:multidrug efflux pump subunit AcrB